MPSAPTEPIPTWAPLAARLDALSLILCGPILRRTEPRQVTVWVALREPRRVTLRIYARDAATGALAERLAGSRRTVRLGKRLHVAAVTARAAEDTPSLEMGRIYCYDLCFADAAAEGDAPQGAKPSLFSPGVLVGDPAKASDEERLVYPGLPLPSFVLPPADLARARIFHGSCRKPHGVGRDALATLDLAIEEAALNPEQRPQQLYLTGDQIYADDVAGPLLPSLTDAGATLVGGETLPELPPELHLVAPTRRAWAVHELARFTTTTPDNHLLARGEYLAMYLFAWSGVLWPDAPPTSEELWRACPEARPEPGEATEKALARWRLETGELADFRETLPRARRALANTPTYMVCDDHDVTDDWYLDGAWCANVLASPLGRRIVRNALYAYALCQAWGNDPDQLDAPNGGSFLATVDRWRGDETDADAALLAEHLALPEEFAGVGSLPRTERALRWHYTVETPAYRMLVLDERTRRVYDEPHAAPGLLADDAIAEQVGAPPEGDGRLTLLVAQTPVLGVDIVEKIQLLSLGHYAYDRESWSLNRSTYQALMQALARFGRVVILSGDVHYGFGSTLDYWEQTADGPRGTATIVNFTSSAMKNAAAGTQKALLTVAYPHLFHLLSRGRMPPVDLCAWQEGSPANANALASATRAVRSGALAVWWSVPRMATLLRSPSALVLPAHGWPAHTFDRCPPDRRMRLRYLHDDCQPVVASAAPLSALGDVAAAHHQHVSEMVAVLTGGAHLGTDRALEATRVLESSEHPHPVRLGVAQRLLELSHTLFGGVRALEERLNAGIGRLLREAVARPELWSRVWSDGDLHIVGDANIGEIRFEEGGQVAVQRLWWYAPSAPDHPTSAPDHPTPATEYRAPLAPPPDDEAPPLP